MENFVGRRLRGNDQNRRDASTYNSVKQPPDNSCKASHENKIIICPKSLPREYSNTPISVVLAQRLWITPAVETPTPERSLSSAVSMVTAVLTSAVTMGVLKMVSEVMKTKETSLVVETQVKIQQNRQCTPVLEPPVMMTPMTTTAIVVETLLTTWAVVSVVLKMVCEATKAKQISWVLGTLVVDQQKRQCTPIPVLRVPHQTPHPLRLLSCFLPSLIHTPQGNNNHNSYCSKAYSRSWWC